MHGVRRGDASTDLSHAEYFSKLASRALAARAANDRSESALQLIARVLEHNPDEYSLWNYRKRVLLDRPAAERPAAWRGELDLTDRALRRHAKAYGAWSHRLWLLSTDGLVDGEVVAGQVARELAMCAGILDVDGRNFHAWAYRMQVRRLAGARGVEEAEEDAAYALSKINADFANYSAWHLRSQALRRLGGGAVEEERELVWQALFTEPEVESGWLYARWLLDGGAGAGGVVTAGGELARVEELLGVEPGARLAAAARARLLAEGGRGAEAAAAYAALATADPLRAGCYAEWGARCAPGQ